MMAGRQPAQAPRPKRELVYAALVVLLAILLLLVTIIAAGPDDSTVRSVYALP